MIPLLFHFQLKASLSDYMPSAVGALFSFSVCVCVRPWTNIIASKRFLEAVVFSIKEPTDVEYDCSSNYWKRQVWGIITQWKWGRKQSLGPELWSETRDNSGCPLPYAAQLASAEILFSQRSCGRINHKYYALLNTLLLYYHSEVYARPVKAQKAFSDKMVP